MKGLCKPVGRKQIYSAKILNDFLDDTSTSCDIFIRQFVLYRKVCIAVEYNTILKTIQMEVLYFPRTLNPQNWLSSDSSNVKNTYILESIFICIHNAIVLLLFSCYLQFWAGWTILRVTFYGIYTCLCGFRLWQQSKGGNIRQHDDVIKWKHFPCYWPFVQWCAGMLWCILLNAPVQTLVYEFCSDNLISLLNLPIPVTRWSTCVCLVKMKPDICR